MLPINWFLFIATFYGAKIYVAERKSSWGEEKRTYGVRSSRGPKTGSYNPPGIGRSMKSSKLALVTFKTLCFRTSSVVMKLNHTASTESVAPYKIQKKKNQLEKKVEILGSKIILKIKIFKEILFTNKILKNKKISRGREKPLWFGPLRRLAVRENETKTEVGDNEVTGSEEESTAVGGRETWE